MKINLINYLNQRQKICSLAKISLHYALKINEMAYKKWPDGNSLEGKALKMEKSELLRLRRAWFVEFCRENNTKTYIMTKAQMREAKQQIEAIEQELEEISAFLGVLEKDNEKFSKLREIVIKTLRSAGVPIEAITTDGLANHLDIGTLPMATEHLFIMVARLSASDDPKDFHASALKFYGHE